MVRPSIDSVIEEIGFGQAQLWTQILAHGVWVADGVELALATALARSISQDLWPLPDAAAEAALSGDARRASLAAVVFTGVAAGAGVGGYLGDAFGRRPPIILSYTGVAAFTLASAAAANLAALLALRALMGLAMGLGMPASLALVSEGSPLAWRAPLMGLRGLLFGAGNIVACLLLLADDPSLERLRWRQDLALSAAVPVVLGIWAFASLRESPLFLARQGRHENARSVLRWMKARNGRRRVDVEYREEAAEEAVVEGPKASPRSWGGQLRIVFGQPLAYSTFVLTAATFTVNLIEYGSAYAEPLVLPATHAALAPGWQLLSKYAIALPIRLGVTFPAALLSRRSALVVAFACFCAVGALLFALTGGLLHRSQLLEATYFGGLYLPVVGIALGFLVVYQLSVEVYPTMAAATGSAFCVAFGRAGAVSAPYIFEAVHGWQLFYCFMAGLALLTAALGSRLPETSATVEWAREDAHASKPLTC